MNEPTGNRQPAAGNRSGALLLDKPIGPTSHDAVACARRTLGERSIGHTGTLDPLASGLLVLLVGRATRLASLLSGASKTYEATVRLGVETDTYDAAGTPQPMADGVAPTSVDDAAIAAAIAAIRAERQQMPPAFSAKKIDGVRAYDLARRAERPVLKPVDVRVFASACTRASVDTLHITLTCSAGYYVRSMAHAIGRHLGCGAHLAALRRTRVGAFEVGDAVTLDGLQQEGRDAGWERLLPVERLLPHLPAVRLTEAGEVRARHGNLLGTQHVAVWEAAGAAADATDADRPGIEVSGAAPSTPAPIRYRVLSSSDRLLAVAEASPAGLQPFIVLTPAE